MVPFEFMRLEEAFSLSLSALVRLLLLFVRGKEVIKAFIRVTDGGDDDSDDDSDAYHTVPGVVLFF